MKPLLILGLLCFVIGLRLGVWRRQKEEAKRNSLVHIARLAEAEGRYEDMATAMKTLVETGVQLSPEEQNLFYAATKQLEHDRAVDLIMERMVFGKKELDKGNTDNTLLAYEEAFDLAKRNLPASHRISLIVSYHLAKFFYETLKSQEKACHLVHKAYDDALADADISKETGNRDDFAERLLALLREKIQVWSCDVDGFDKGDKEKLKENVLRRLRRKVGGKTVDDNKAKLLETMETLINFYSNLNAKYSDDVYGKMTDNEKQVELELFVQTVTTKLQILLHANHNITK